MMFGRRLFTAVGWGAAQDAQSFPGMLTRQTLRWFVALVLQFIDPAEWGLKLPQQMD
jgi:hypothetical protein